MTQSCLQAGQWDLGISTAEEALTIYPGQKHILLVAMQICIDGGRGEHLQKFLTQALEAAPTDQRLLDIGEKYGKSSAQVVLRWDLQRGVIPLPKSVHSTRIMQNIHVFDFELDESEMQLISSLDTGKRNGADPNNFDF